MWYFEDGGNIYLSLRLWRREKPLPPCETLKKRETFTSLWDFEEDGNHPADQSLPASWK